MIKKTPNKLAIIVPVFNEERIIGQVLEEILAEAKTLHADIFVVNDGSTDDTLKILKTFGKKIEIISYRQNQGKGYALRYGTDRVYEKYDVIAWIDGDGQLISSDISKMLAALTADVEMIISERIINFKVLPTSKIGRGIVRSLFNALFHSKIEDHLSGLRVFRSSVYEKIRWRSNDYRVEVESLACAVVNNIKYKEVKTVCNKKLYRGIRWQDGLKIYYWIFWCYFHRKKLIYLNNKYDGCTSLLISKSPIRSHIRRELYIKNILRFVRGKTIDFDCKVGEVLKFLPPGSMGLDTNKMSIQYCQDNNLNAKFYDVIKDKYNLNFLKNQNYKTFLMNHVLEHIKSPEEIFEKILKSLKKLKVNRLIVVVPAYKGFLSNETHQDYINRDFFLNKIKSTDFKIIHQEYYPVNSELVGYIFRYQELVVVFERVK